MPGGCNDLGESAKECAIREVFEESGYNVEIKELMGIFSSTKYEYINYPWKETEFCHVLFSGEIAGGSAQTSDETTEVKWFGKDEIENLSDGQEERIEFAWKKYFNPSVVPYFE